MPVFSGRSAIEDASETAALLENGSLRATFGCCSDAIAKVDYNCSDRDAARQ